MSDSEQAADAGAERSWHPSRGEVPSHPASATDGATALDLGLQVLGAECAFDLRLGGGEADLLAQLDGAAELHAAHAR